MPISREAFQIKNPGDENDVGEDFTDALDASNLAGIVDASAIVDKEAVGTAAPSEDESGSRSIGDARVKESPEKVSKEDEPILPPADSTSAEKKEAFGAAYPQRETRRSVATGRDVPQFTPRPQERDSMEFNWDEARAQTEVYERRARAQKGAATEHLARIHDIVGLLIEMSETHSNEGKRKLESLESKVAELETRFSINRSSP
jgi:hypothetical protein